jgi:hypothetical protein
MHTACLTETGDEVLQSNDYMLVRLSEALLKRGAYGEVSAHSARNPYSGESFSEIAALEDENSQLIRRTTAVIARLREQRI